MIAASLSIAGRTAGITYATPSERQTDAQCAQQDQAAETMSLLSRDSRIDRLAAEPGPLDRFRDDPA